MQYFINFKNMTKWYFKKSTFCQMPLIEIYAKKMMMSQSLGQCHDVTVCDHNWHKLSIGNTSNSIRGYFTIQHIKLWLLNIRLVNL